MKEQRLACSLTSVSHWKATETFGGELYFQWRLRKTIHIVGVQILCVSMQRVNTPRKQKVPVEQQAKLA